MKIFKPGDMVRLTGAALRSMGGHFKGHEGNKKWTVRHCRCSFCSAGTHICTDEETVDNGDPEYMAAVPYRHLHVGNLEKINA